jgi:cysteine desulfurase/selenocysteine lyase
MTSAVTGKRSTNLPAYDVQSVRRDFPILAREVHGRPLVFLDSGASAQKPRAVIDAVSRFYENDYANIHRGVYLLSAEATRRYDAARERVSRFLNARDAGEIVFTRNATEAINLVASSFGGLRLRPGDEILLTEVEHHANIVPWQLIAQRTGATVRAAPVDDDGRLVFEEFVARLTPRTAMVAVTHASNVLGTFLPVEDIVREAHGRGIPVLVDGSQSAVHATIDVQAMGCDFFVFTGHKLYGPSGIGVLYGRREHLAAMPPYQGGGDMIERVTFERTTFAPPPERFEAGTPNIAGAIGLAAAIDYVESLGRDAVAAHEQALLEHATARLGAIDGIRLLGTKGEKASILSFLVDGVHPHDVGTILDRAGIAVRVGHHCAQPLMDRFDIAGTVRASFGLYNTLDEVDVLAEALGNVREIFG